METKKTGKITKKDLKRVFWRSFTIQNSWAYDKMMALGYSYSMIPVLEKLYTTKDKLTEALTRHMELFNTTPQISTFIMGLTTAMEEENAQNDNFHVDSITAIKTALMGPLAGIGDSFYWGTFRIIAAGIGLQFAQRGSILGPILYFIIYTALHLSARYYGLFLGYDLGLGFLQKAEKNNVMGKISNAASVVGLMVVGCMTATMVEFNIGYEWGSGEGAFSVQKTLDGLFPGLLPLLYTFLVHYLIKKKQVKPAWLILGTFALGFVLNALGIMS